MTRIELTHEALVEEVRRQDVGLMTIKTVSRRNWPERHGPLPCDVVRAIRRSGSRDRSGIMGAVASKR